MYTIGQFSRITRLPVRTLRYYDQEGLLKPALVNPETGYRYYSPEQIPLVAAIGSLKEMGIPLETVREVMAGRLSLRDILEDHRSAIQSKVNQYLTALARIDQILAQMGGSRVSAYKVDVKEVPEMRVLASRQKAAITEIGSIIEKLWSAVMAAGLTVEGPVMARYFDEDFNPEETDYEVCIPVSGPGTELAVIPRAKVVYTTHVGSFEEVGKAYQALMDECASKGYRIVGPPVEVYLRGPESTRDPGEWLTEIRFPIE